MKLNLRDLVYFIRNHHIMHIILHLKVFYYQEQEMVSKYNYRFYTCDVET